MKTLVYCAYINDIIYYYYDLDRVNYHASIDYCIVPTPFPTVICNILNLLSLDNWIVLREIVQPANLCVKE